MNPTPPPHSSFADNFRFRSRRQRHVNPYDPNHNTTPTQAHSPPQVTPLVDDEDGDGEGAAEELSDAEFEDEDGDGDLERDIEEEHNDGEEEEGGIEEGMFCSFFHSLPNPGPTTGLLYVHSTCPIIYTKDATPTTLGDCTGTATTHSCEASCPGAAGIREPGWMAHAIRTQC